MTRIMMAAAERITDSVVVAVWHFGQQTEY